MLVTTTHDEERRLLREDRGESLVVSVGEEDLADLTWELVKSVDDGVSSSGHRKAVLSELNGHHGESDVLRSVGLGRSDSDFRSSVDVNSAMRFSRDGRTDDVDDTDVEGTTFETVSHGEDSVGSFSRLRNENADIVSEDGGFAVEEIGGEFDRDGDFGELFEDGTSLE